VPVPLIFEMIDDSYTLVLQTIPRKDRPA
jgi:predicted DNA-binding protein (MmcQ/YjbR family)